MNRIDRLLGYLLIFQSRRLVRASDLAARFEISERTVYRDIEALCDVGVPIVGIPGEGYRLLEDYYLPPVMFTETEARSLSLAVAIFAGLAEEGATRKGAIAAIEKIHALLPRTMLDQIEALQAIIGFHSVGRTRLNLDDRKLLILQQAIQQQQVVHIRYHAGHDNQVTERDIEPLYLAFVNEVWILAAYCRLRQDQRNFRLNRIDQLAPLRENFAPRNIEPYSQLDGALVVRARFEADTVRWVQERQHFMYIGEQVPDEDGAVVMEYRVDSAQQILGWLLQWGSNVEVLAPAEIRKEMARAAILMLEKHRR